MSILNISEFGTGRQAKNVLPHALSATVSPWFADVAQDRKVQKALQALNQDSSRSEALEFLGLEIEEFPRPLVA